MKFKKVSALIFALFILAGSLSWAYTPAFMGYSAIKTADALIYTGESWLYGIVVATDATNSVTVEIYDNTSATGTQVHPDWIVPTSASNRMSVLSFDPPLNMDTGIYVDVTTSGTVSYTVYYRTK